MLSAIMVKCHSPDYKNASTIATMKGVILVTGQ